uniref:Uncharacterized protein n=1 Tax=Glossina pallidipes TaxID=7398 RepID=A0A1A9ZIB0_GLOPL
MRGMQFPLSHVKRSPKQVRPSDLQYSGGSSAPSPQSSSPSQYHVADPAIVVWNIFPDVPNLPQSVKKSVPLQGSKTIARGLSTRAIITNSVPSKFIASGSLSIIFFGLSPLGLLPFILTLPIFTGTPDPPSSSQNNLPSFGSNTICFGLETDVLFPLLAIITNMVPVCILEAVATTFSTIIGTLSNPCSLRSATRIEWRFEIMRKAASFVYYLLVQFCSSSLLSKQSSSPSHTQDLGMHLWLLQLSDICTLSFYPFADEDLEPHLHPKRQCQCVDLNRSRPQLSTIF